VRLHFARSRGPGGQNVNKVNSKAEIRFDLDKAHWLPQYTRRHLREQVSLRDPRVAVPFGAAPANVAVPRRAAPPACAPISKRTGSTRTAS